MSSIKLRAIYPEKNINRDYEIRIDKVFFGLWSVTTAYGRRHQKGMLRNYIFETYEEAKKFFDKTLNKRLNAKNRIGCNYLPYSYEG